MELTNKNSSSESHPDENSVSAPHLEPEWCSECINSARELTEFFYFEHLKDVSLKF
jgi:hypothetical protein